MGFLRRLLGGSDAGEAPATNDAASADPAQIDAEERARELELTRFDQERTDDLVRRQQRFAALSWTPPAQGGERRAEDNDRTE
jgi:hypothetical protein